MLDSGKTSQIGAAAKLIVSYVKSSGLVADLGDNLRGAPVNAAASALSKADFQNEVRKLNPNAREYNAQYEALVKRRTVGRTLGL